MNTPICDFVEAYINNDPIRMHMPGHKGKPLLGFEPRDITEINGADSLFEATGIIAESEMNASSLFGCNSFYSTEGSSLAIRGMMYLLKLWRDNPLIIASRNSHKTFISAVSALDLEVQWLYPAETESYLSCTFDLPSLDKMLRDAEGRSCAVYITSPDYLGNIADIKAISEICKSHGALLLVDNAHGAYLKFLSPSLHPMDLGADMCCDSAHKTLPVATGGAYLHISHSAPELFKARAKEAMAFFGSTSPSYPILASLDRANRYLFEGYSEKLRAFTDFIRKIKDKLTAKGYTVIGNDELKIVIQSKNYGYSGLELENILKENGIFCEFAHKDHLVLMVTPENSGSDIEKATEVLLSIDRKAAIVEQAPSIHRCEYAISPKSALFSQSEIVPIADAVGRIYAEINAACPPAVPLIAAGEIIDRETVERFEYYGISQCRVVCKK